MKRKLNIILFILIAVMCCGLFAVQASAATTDSGTCGDNLTWVLDNDGTLTISGTGEMTSNPWYDYRSSIKSVIIENGVTIIANSAFYNCSNLEDVTLPNSIETIGDISFKYCSKLTKFIVPYGTKQLGYEFLANCTSLEAVFVPNTIESVGSALFENCTLSTLWVPKSFSENYDFRFWPEGASIDTEGSLQYCDTWAEITDNNILRIFGGEEIADYAPAKEKFSLLWDYYNYAESIVIESGITSIGADTFKNFANCKSIVIPDTVTSIGYHAFYKLTSLSEITIPSSVTSISKYAFSYCDSLTTIYGTANSTAHSFATENGYKFVDVTTGEEYTILASGTCDYNIEWKLEYDGLLTISPTSSWATIGSCYFDDAPWYTYRSKIKKVIIEPGIEAIGSRAFEGCVNLTEVVISEGVEEINFFVFEGCDNLTEITIPSSVEDIWDDAFYGCDNLENIIVDSQNSNYSSISGVLFNKSKSTLICCPSGKSGEYIVPDMVTKIEDKAFRFCVNLSNIQLNDNLLSIGNRAFAGCNSLTKVTIPSLVSSIDTDVFSGCNNLKSINVDSDNNYYASLNGVLFDADFKKLIAYPNGKETIYEVPDGVTDIAESAFNTLESITFPRSISNIETKAFSACENLKTVYYLGTDKEWSNVSIGTENEPLTEATFYCRYIITYDANEGTPTPEQQEINYDETINLSTITPTKEGYDFLGWSTQKDTTTAEYLPGAEFSTDSSVTLYAVWQIKTYTVAYDANGGTNTPDSQTKIYGEDLTLSSIVPLKEGHIFKGWTSIKDSSTPEYQSGDLFAVNEDTILYAIWEAETYTVTYDANGGENAPNIQTKTYGEDLTLSNTVPTKDGYIFRGWATADDLTTVKYQPNTIYSSNEALSLYAVWEIITYTVSYDANGGTNVPENQTKIYGTDLTLSNDVPIRDGHIFKGWSTSKNATAPEYMPNAAYTENKPLSLYAVWEIETYVVSYEVNGGTNAPSVQTKTYGVDLTLSSVTPIKAGHIFKGWATEKDSDIVKYQPNDILSMNGDVVLYAVWQIETYSISYNANGGNNAPDNQEKTYGVDLTLSNSIPTKDGYVFMGWSINSNGGTIDYAAGSLFSTDADTILYAVWQKKLSVPTINTTDCAGGKEISISSDDNALIYYTIDGSIPDENSTLYDASFVLTNSTTIKAIAIKTDCVDSEVTSIDVTISTIEKIIADTESGNVEIGTIIKLSATIPDARIYYTIDGNIPDEKSLLYTDGINISSATTIKAIAIYEGYANSEIFSWEYSIIKVQKPSISVTDFVGGKKVEIQAEDASNIYYTIDGSEPTVESAKYTEAFSISTVGSYDIRAIAVKDNCLTSDISDVASVNIQKVSPLSPNIESGTVLIGSAVQLDCTTENITIYYTTDGTEPDFNSQVYNSSIIIDDNTTIKAIAVANGMVSSDVIILNYNVKTLSAPVINESNILGGKSISITATEGIIYYTLDGSEPNEQSAIYTEAIVLEESATIKTIAVKEGTKSSPVTEKDVIVSETSLPQLNIESGSVVEIGTVATLLYDDYDIVYYTNDGSTPNEESLAYSTGITINDDCIIKLYAINSGHSKSDVVEYAFAIAQSEKPVITVTDVYGGKEITLSANEKDTIYYTLDGTTPDKNSNEYTGKFTASEDTTITVAALRDTAKISESATENIVVEKSISPTFSVNTDSVMEDTECKLFADGYTIYYTLDGTDPLLYGKTYETPIVLTESVQIKAVAVKLGSAYSDISTKNITVTILPSIKLELIEDNGDTVKIAAEIAENSGISSALLKLKYPKAALSYVDIEKGTMLNDGICNVHETDDGLNILLINANNSYENGKLFTVSLSRNDNYTTDVPISVTYSSGDIINDSFEDINPKLNNASITLSNNTYEYGISILEKDVIYSSTKVDGKVTLNVQSSKDNKTADLIVAIYDEEGKLLNITSNDMTLTLGNNSKTVDVSAIVPETCNSVTVKFLLWESINSIKPLCAVEEMTVSK